MQLESKKSRDLLKAGRPKISQTQADEIRKQQLQKLLDEQEQKIRDREKKLKAKENDQAKGG